MITPPMLHKLEKNYGIKVLFAVESGSRLWRMESTDSDYDVRFVYHKRLEDYMALHQVRDVIEIKGSLWDFVGFDLYKFAKLLMSSNPSLIEWLNSDMIYIHTEWLDRFRDLMAANFNPLALYHHYRSMCKNNYLTYIKEGRGLTYKKYLYAMRGLVCATYVEQFNIIPPLNFEVAVAKVAIPDELHHELLKVIHIKRLGLEKDKTRIPLFEKVIEEFIAKPVEIAPKEFKAVDKLQSLIFEILGVKSEIHS